MRDLSTQGNAVAMMHYIESLETKLERGGVSTKDVFHDLAILALGDWEKEKMGHVISEWFKASKETGIVRNLNLTAEVQKIALLSDMTGTFRPSTPLRYV